MSHNATIVIAGITLIAPTDLVSAAGFEPYSDGSPSRSRQPSAGYRLMRALSEHAPGETAYAPGQALRDSQSLRILLRAVELAEIERTESNKTEQLRLVAQMEAKAAADHRAAAGISITAQRLAMEAK